MYYSIFDTRPQHNGKPFLFDCGCGRYYAFVTESIDKANDLCEKMNTITSLTTYEVKPYKADIAEIAISKIYFK